MEKRERELESLQNSYQNLCDDLHVKNDRMKSWKMKEKRHQDSITSLQTQLKETESKLNQKRKLIKQLQGDLEQHEQLASMFQKLALKSNTSRKAAPSSRRVKVHYQSEEDSEDQDENNLSVPQTPEIKSRKNDNRKKKSYMSDEEVQKTVRRGKPHHRILAPNAHDSDVSSINFSEGE